MNATAAPNAFDASIAEDAINRFLEKTLGGMYRVLESSVSGVVALDRIDPYNARKPEFSFDELACTVARETGYTLLCIANADWSTNDGPDEEATYFAFDVPDLDQGYVDPYRNNIHGPITPTTASAEDFDKWRAARTYIEGRFEELKGKMKYATGGDLAMAKTESDNLMRIGKDLRAWDRDIVSALLARDMDRALAAQTAKDIAESHEADEAAPAPTAP